MRTASAEVDEGGVVGVGVAGGGALFYRPLVIGDHCGIHTRDSGSREDGVGAGGFLKSEKEGAVNQYKNM